MAKKRERLEVIYDILVSIRNNNHKVGPTKLLSASNLSSAMFKDYISELFEKGFIEELTEKKKRYFVLTKKGYEYLDKYKEIIAFIDNFGL